MADRERDLYSASPVSFHAEAPQKNSGTANRTGAGGESPLTKFVARQCLGMSACFSVQKGGPA
jgi:hypothetical protein